MINKHKIAIFASGYGSNFEAITRAAQRGEINADVVLLVCDKPQARACAIAAELGVEVLAFSAKDFSSKQEYESLIVEKLNALGVELICLAGYMKIVGDTLLDGFAGKIINIHPSLLPAFKGAKAIEQALEYGVKVFGVTIHYVDNTLDGGVIIAQRAIEYSGNDINELVSLIHAIEHPLYIETIEKLLKKEN